MGGCWRCCRLLSTSDGARAGPGVAYLSHQRLLAGRDICTRLQTAHAVEAETASLAGSASVPPWEAHLVYRLHGRSTSYTWATC